MEIKCTPIFEIPSITPNCQSTGGGNSSTPLAKLALVTVVWFRVCVYFWPPSFRPIPIRLGFPFRRVAVGLTLRSSSNFFIKTPGTGIQRGRSPNSHCQVEAKCLAKENYKSHTPHVQHERSKSHRVQRPPKTAKHPDIRPYAERRHEQITSSSNIRSR